MLYPWRRRRRRRATGSPVRSAMPGRCRSVTTASSATARSRRSSPPAARWTGCACRASTRRARSAPSSAGGRARSGWRRWTSRCPPTAATCPGTMILETSWATATGWIIVRDALLIGPWHHQDDRSLTYRRTPNDYEAEHILLRTIRCVSGEVQTIMDCEPVLDYGRAHVRWEYTGESYHQATGERRRHRRHADPHHRHAAGLRRRAGQHPHAAQGGRRPLRRPVVGRRGAAHRPTTTPTSARSGPPTTGSTGWPAASSPTTRGAATCSAARSR